MLYMYWNGMLYPTGIYTYYVKDKRIYIKICIAFEKATI